VHLAKFLWDFRDKCLSIPSVTFLEVLLEVNVLIRHSLQLACICIVL